MFVYENILFHVLNKYYINNSKQNNNILYLFSCHFLSHSKMNIHNYSTIEYIQFKYYILKNFIFNPSTSCEDKEILLKTFCEVQCKYNALVRFKQILSMKTKNYLDSPIDLQFNEMTEIKEHLKIDIIHQGIKYNFSVSDLIRIINTSLSYDDEFFPEPTVIKNPWNNKPFGKNHLYSIYFHILHSNIKMPILFSRFFQSNFNLKEFVLNNQYIINRYIIENSNNLTDILKLGYILDMINDYNILVYDACKINISKSFPNSIIHAEFDSYIKLYLFAHYSYEDDIRIINHKKLFKQLKRFNILNPYFGKIVKYNDINKMYYLSNMIENSDCHIFGIPMYFPKPSMFCLKEESFYIDSITSYAKTNDFSYFPLFENRNEQYKQNKQNKQNEQDKQNNFILKCNDILQLFHFVRDYKFSDKQKEIIKNKYNNDITDSSMNEPDSNINDMSEQLRELLSNLHNLQLDIHDFNDTISDDDSDDEVDEDPGGDDDTSDIQREVRQIISLITNTLENEHDEYEEMYRFHTAIVTDVDDNNAMLSDDSSL